MPQCCMGLWANEWRGDLIHTFSQTLARGYVISPASQILHPCTVCQWIFVAGWQRVNTSGCVSGWPPGQRMPQWSSAVSDALIPNSALWEALRFIKMAKDIVSKLPHIPPLAFTHQPAPTIKLLEQCRWVEQPLSPCHGVCCGDKGKKMKCFFFVLLLSLSLSLSFFMCLIHPFASSHCHIKGRLNRGRRKNVLQCNFNLLSGAWQVVPYFNACIYNGVHFT